MLLYLTRTVIVSNRAHATRPSDAGIGGGREQDEEGFIAFDKRIAFDDYTDGFAGLPRRKSQRAAF